MRFKSIFLDETFLYSVGPSISGFIFQNLVTLIILMVIWVGGSFTTVVEYLFDKRQHFIVYCLLFGLFAVVVYIFECFIRKKKNLFLIPIRPIRLKQIRRYRSIYGEKGYSLPLITLIALFIFFLIPFILGVEWQEAAINAVLAILPFHLGFLTWYIVSIGLEIIALFTRYMFHHNRF